ncbi:hypothetical protein ACLQ26_09515 [Micromonospora sp. DT43]|uniref:hypothetical protein n=1 Tax=Micromonospora sp. DT43 TaxID=3393440 RepID=UPI003CF23F4D
MDGATWLLVGMSFALLLAVVALVLVRMTAKRRLDAAAEGRLAIKQLGGAANKRGRGTIRGTGSEGSSKLSSDAAYGSDTSSGA